MAVSGIRKPATNAVYILVFSVRYIASALITKETALLTIPPLLRHVFVVLETCLSSRCLATAVSSGSIITVFGHYVKSVILSSNIRLPGGSFSSGCLTKTQYMRCRGLYVAGNILSEDILFFLRQIKPYSCNKLCREINWFCHREHQNLEFEEV
jgi:hypothetical protein